MQGHFATCLLFYLYSFSNIFQVISAEYNIKNEVPSYLYRTFDNLKEEIFPENIRIKMLLRRITGTLLYSIDQHKNQLIVSLHEVMEPTIGIEFRNKELILSLDQLCGCKLCRYHVLSLEIEIKDKIYISCNDRSVQSYLYVETLGINDGYPEMRPYNISLLNQANLWLINTPYDKGLYPNQEQLTGCIFTVWYNHKQITFPQLIGNIERKCQKICRNNICNGGECLETYGRSPVCNCTMTYMNGDYCNETVFKEKLSYIKYNRIEMLKVSWTGSSKEILKLNNSNVQILLFTNNSELIFKMTFVRYKTSITSIISPNYEEKKGHILIIKFSEKFINIQFFADKTSYENNLYSYLDLRAEKFPNISEQNYSGLLGFAYKSSVQELKWENIYILKKQNIPEDKISKNIFNESRMEYSSQENKEQNTKYLYLFIPLIIGIILIVALLVYFCNKRKKANKTSMKKHSKSFESLPLMTDCDILDEKIYSWTFDGKRRLFLSIKNLLISIHGTEDKYGLYKKITNLLNHACNTTKVEEKILTDLEKLLNLQLSEETNEPSHETVDSIIEKVNSTIIMEEKINSRLKKVFRRAVEDNNAQLISQMSYLMDQMNKQKSEEESTLSSLQGVLDESMQIKRRNLKIKFYESKEI